MKIEVRDFKEIEYIQHFLDDFYKVLSKGDADKIAMHQHNFLYAAYKKARDIEDFLAGEEDVAYLEFEGPIAASKSIHQKYLAYSKGRRRLQEDFKFSKVAIGDKILESNYLVFIEALKLKANENGGNSGFLDDHHISRYRKGFLIEENKDLWHELGRRFAKFSSSLVEEHKGFPRVIGYEDIVKKIPQRDLLIYINITDHNTLLDRIRRRARDSEKGVTAEYLKDNIKRYKGGLGTGDNFVLGLDGDAMCPELGKIQEDWTEQQRNDAIDKSPLLEKDIDLIVKSLARSLLIQGRGHLIKNQEVLRCPSEARV